MFELKLELQASTILRAEDHGEHRVMGKPLIRKFEVLNGKASAVAINPPHRKAAAPMTRRIHSSASIKEPEYRKGHQSKQA